MSGDETMIKAFNNGLDVHMMVASIMFSVPYEEVTKSQRTIAKCVPAGTPVLTDKGFVNIEDLDEFMAWDGLQFSPAKAFKQEEPKECAEVYTESEYAFEASLDHRVPCWTEYGLVDVEVQDLTFENLILRRDAHTGLLLILRGVLEDFEVCYQW